VQRLYEGEEEENPPQNIYKISLEKIKNLVDLK
jgi:hypothetical protein